MLQPFKHTSIREKPHRIAQISSAYLLMANAAQPKDRDDFEIAIICALRSEADAVEALFDEYWDEDGDRYGKAPGDTNTYSTGAVGRHNVVLAHMPGMGKGSAASVSSSFRCSFGRIKLALVVGICGGVPILADGEEILLGDVIISTGIIQYDFGRQLPDRFVRKDTLGDNLGRPNTEIRAFLSKLGGLRDRKRLGNNTFSFLQELCKEADFQKACYPGPVEDKLYERTYRHKHHDLPTCTICTKCERKVDKVCGTALESSCSDLKCNDTMLVPRQRLPRSSDAWEAAEEQKPHIHFGLIASGDAVMKSGEDRDEIADKEKVIGFEMEGAGVWDNFPCVVIKGVCDYADSHKNKKWQGYAAAAAAACMKAFLKEWVPTMNPSAGAVVQGM
jgi:nucleoside phosphorylase